MMNRCLFLILFLCLGTLPMYGQLTAPKYSNEFLKIPVGARAQGMGGAAVATSQGAESGYWNPANLLHLTYQHNASLMHTEFFGGVTSYDFLSYATPLDSLSSFGLTALRLGVDDIPDTRFLYDANGNINYDNVTLFSAADYAFLVSYARRLQKWPELEFGANVKVIHRRAGDFAKAWGVGIDVAINYSLNDWRFSAVGKDVTGTFNAWNHSSDLLEDVFNRTGNTLPDNSVEVSLPQLVIGVARTFEVNENFDLLGTVDLQATFDGKRNSILRTNFISANPVVGLEANYKQKLSVRTGLGGFQQADESWQTSPHFGLGVHLSWFTIDYGLSRISGLENGLFTHSFSINLGIDE